MRSPVPLVTVLILVVGFTAPAMVAAQEATPASTAAEIVVSGLVNPRSFLWGPDGALYVAITGTGGLPATSATSSTATPGDARADGTPVIEDVAASTTVANDAAIVRIEDGCQVVVAGGLPSSGLPSLNWAVGITGTAFLDGRLYYLVDGGGEAGLHPEAPNGLYRVEADGTTSLVADLSAWFRANPTAHLWGEISPDGEPFGLVAGGGLLWITESNHEQVLTVTPDGIITRVVDLSPLGDVVPTGIALAPGGGVYVGFLTALPWTDGVAKVIKVDPDGTMTDVWTGLTAVTDVTVGPDGALYATEMSTGNTDTEPYYRLRAGKVVRQTGPNTAEEIARGLDYPVHLEFGPDGGLYVATPAIGANGGEGMIVRIDPTAAPVSLEGMTTPASTC